MLEQALEAWQWRAFRLFLSSLVDYAFAASPPCRGRSPRRVHKIANTGTIDYESAGDDLPSRALATAERRQ